MKAALYLRLSREDRTESIENQESILRTFCKENGYEIYKIYKDIDYSGLYDTRPSFIDMMSDAQNKRFDIVLVKNLSRFTRNFMHAEEYIEEKLQKHGIRLIGVSDGIDSQKRFNKKARQINALINEWYCEDLSTNVRAVLKEKMLSGQFIGSKPPYGYSKSYKDKHSLQINSREAETVKMIFESYINGMSVKEIAKQLNDKGIITPGQDRKIKWREGMIYRILSNMVYTGRLVQGKTENVNYKCKKRIYKRKSCWIIIDNAHQAIIDDAIFEKVQIMKTRRHN